MLKEDPNQGFISRNIEQVGSQTVRIKDPVVVEEQRYTVHRQRHKRSQLTYILKTLNFVTAIAFIAYSAYCYAYGYQEADLASKGPFVRYVFPAYFALSGILILMVECRVAFVIRNLRFFFTYFGRGFFNIYAGLMPLILINDWSSWQNLTTFEIVTVVVSSIMCLIGLLYFGLRCLCCKMEGDRAQLQQRRQRIRNLQNDDDYY